MAQKFVPYSPDVEQPEPDFERTLQRVLNDMKEHMRGSLKTEGIGLMVRNAHAKGYGLALGEFEIIAGMPSAYAQGIYAKPGRHEAMVRFSNGTSHVGGDRFLGPINGIGLKIFGIEGKTLLEDESDSNTFDYALINYPVFFVNTLAHYVFIQALFADVGLPPPANLTPEERQAELHRGLYNFVTGKGTLPPEQWAWEELGALLQLAQAKPVNLLLSTYWTMGAVRHGDFIAKVRVAPVQSFADRVEQRTLDLTSAEQVFRPALVAELRERPFEFDVQVQLCADLARMPVEKTTVLWPESLSPYMTVAKLRLPQQDIGGEDNFEKMDKTSMSAWRVTEQHRPLGSIMRSRKEAYRQSSILRHQENHQERREPKNLAEVFGEQMQTQGMQGQKANQKGGTMVQAQAKQPQKASETEPNQIVKEKLQRVRELYADAPELGRVALENGFAEFQREAAAATEAQSAGRIGGRQGKVSELTVISPLAKGGAKRLRALLQLLQGSFQGADAVGTVHDMRFVFLDNDTKLLFATAYDGDWDVYIDDFATKIPIAMDVLFCNFDGWPGIRSPKVKDWIVEHQVAAESWYVANPNLTVTETRRLEHVGKAVEEFLDKIA